MKKYLLLPFFTTALVFFSQAQPAKFKFTLNGSEVNVIAVLEWDDASSCLAGANVVIFTPPNVEITLASITPGPGWSWTRPVYFPEFMGVAVHQFNSVSTIPNFNASIGLEVLLFSFPIPSDCTEGMIRLMEQVDHSTPSTNEPDLTIYNAGVQHTFAASFNGNCTETSGVVFNGLVDPILIVECGAMPVEFLSFTARRSGATALLNWATASEQSNEYFAVQRSRNGAAFETIGKVPGAINSSAKLDYQFVDERPYSGRNYYRIVQVDIDGQSTSTEIREVRFGGTLTSGKLFAYPNPSHEGLHIDLPEGIDASELALLDNLGRTIFTRTISEGSIYEYIDYTKANIGPGVYILQVANDLHVIDHEKVIVH